MKIGKQIKLLRLQKNLTQSELADRCELTKGYISQLENDLTSPSIATLIDILNVLGTNLKSFFNDNEEKEQIIFSQNDYFVKEEEEYKITWLIPNAQKNMMEPILLELEPSAKTLEDFPHEGEEFGYVLEGVLLLINGKNVQKIKKGESFYITSNKIHYLENIGKTKAKIIWVSTPPSF